MLAFLRLGQRTPLRLRLAVTSVRAALPIPIPFVSPEEN